MVRTWFVDRDGRNLNLFNPFMPVTDEKAFGYLALYQQNARLANCWVIDKQV